VGGQALIEGIMMRGKYNWAVAVREPSGSIYVEEHDLASGRDKNSWLRAPVVRGCTALVESLALGYKALEIASQHAFDFEETEDEEEAAQEQQEAQEAQEQVALQGAEAAREQQEQTAFQDVESVQEAQERQQTSPLDVEAGAQASLQDENVKDVEEVGAAAGSSQEENAIPKPLMTASMIVGILLGIGLFIALPALITNLLVGDYGEKTLLWNLLDGVIRIAVFVFYLWLIGRMKDIKRMFGYHGAEHKTIHCYEHGLELTVANARKFPTLHVRCGTAFLLMTMLIAILVFTLVPVAPLIDALGVTNGVARLALVICSRIILMPLIAGLSYEVTVKWAGAHPESPFVQFILWPGMQMQRLTTNQPDDGMLECAIASMQQVLTREKKEQAPTNV
jgi:uncharacterized protein YqhQ